jgi:hypothetical protein
VSRRVLDQFDDSDTTAAPAAGAPAMGSVTRLPPPAAPIGRNGKPLSMTANAI